MGFDPIQFALSQPSENVTLDLTGRYIEGITSINDIIFLLLSKGGGMVTLQNGANAFWKHVHGLKPKYLNLSDGLSDTRITVSTFMDRFDDNGNMYIGGSAIVSMGADLEIKCVIFSATGSDITIKVLANVIQFPETGVT